MDNSLTLARHFARLTWLLLHEPQSVSEQKAALRAVITVSKEQSVRLAVKEGQLGVNTLVMPHVLAGVQEMVERMPRYGIGEIEFTQDASASELLALARLLAAEESAVPSDAGAAAQALAALEGRTVLVRPLETAPPVAAPTASPLADTKRGSIPEYGSERVRFLFAQLHEVSTALHAIHVLDEIAFQAEMASRQGEIAAVVEIFLCLIDRESALTDPELRRAHVMTLRRLTKPVLLRPVAQLLAHDATRVASVERILRRCGQDGVDVVVDQYLAAGSIAERLLYHDVLFRLGSTYDALVHMLADPRWPVVRQAVEFLGELGVPEADRPLAELLRHPDERVRRAVTRALARLETHFTLDALARAISDDAATVRLEAIAALAARKGGRAGATLARAVDDEAEIEVQHALLAALGRVATPEAVQKLSKAAEAASGLFKSRKNIGLRVAAVQALAEAKTPGALAALQGLAGDKEKEVRDAVERARAPVSVG